MSAKVETPLRLLLVDDEGAIQRMFSRYLTRRGHRVEVASDGREALGAIDALDEGEAYDVILTDLRMPGMSGDALYARLRDRGDGTDRTVVFLTGDTSSVEATRLLASMAAPVIYKPVPLPELATRIEQRAAELGGRTTDGA